METTAGVQQQSGFICSAADNFSAHPKSSLARIDKRTARAAGNTRYRYNKIGPLDHIIIIINGLFWIRMHRRPVWQGSTLSCVAFCYSIGIVMGAVCNLVCAGPVDFSGGDNVS